MLFDMELGLPSRQQGYQWALRSKLPVSHAIVIGQMPLSTEVKDICTALKQFPSLSKARLRKVIWGSKWSVVLIDEGCDLWEEEWPPWLCILMELCLEDIPTYILRFLYHKGKMPCYPPLTAPLQNLVEDTVPTLPMSPVKRRLLCWIQLSQSAAQRRTLCPYLQGSCRSCSFPCGVCCCCSGVVHRKGQSTCGDGAVQGIACFCSSEDPVYGGERR
ncbi:hypothetical protein FKM82_020779 [Ascaphus truei]